MIAVTIVMIVTNVIKKFESLQRGWFQPNPFVTTKNLYILFLNITVNESFTVAFRDGGLYILALFITIALLFPKKICNFALGLSADCRQ